MDSTYLIPRTSASNVGKALQFIGVECQQEVHLNFYYFSDALTLSQQAAALDASFTQRGQAVEGHPRGNGITGLMWA